MNHISNLPIKDNKLFNFLEFFLKFKPIQLYQLISNIKSIFNININILLIKNTLIYKHILIYILKKFNFKICFFSLLMGLNQKFNLVKTKKNFFVFTMMNLSLRKNTGLPFYLTPYTWSLRSGLFFDVNYRLVN